MPLRVLVVEQTETLRTSFAQTLGRAGYDVYTAKTVPEAAEQFAKHGAAVVVLDLLLPGGDALVFMAGILGALPQTRVIATTASGAMRQAAAAIDAGAFDYLVKPVDAEALIASTQNAAVRIDVAQDGDVDPREKDRRAAIFGANLKTIYRMAQSSAPVLIEGEVGTGKQDCAVLMHQCSTRAGLPFVAVNCAEVVENDLEAVFTKELLAEGGTLYLSEPSLLPLNLQTQLLRFLQSALLNSNRARGNLFNIRVICGMSTLAEDAVDAGRLREDLFYRLKVVRISLKPLRRRNEVIPELAQILLSQLAEQNQKSLRQLSEEAGGVLVKLAWPGNIAQLQSVLSRCVQRERGAVLKVDMLPDALRDMGGEDGVEGPQSDHLAVADTTTSTLADLVRAGWSLVDLERLLIETAIDQNGGSIPKAAKQLSVSPSTLYRKKEGWDG